MANVAMRLRACLRQASGRRLVVAVPMVFLLASFLLPFAIVGRISLAEMQAAGPSALCERAGEVWRLTLYLGNYARLAADALYVDAYATSIGYAAAATLLCLAIGYPFAYFMARAPRSAQPALAMAVMLPFWTSFLLRVYAWRALLAPAGWVERLVVASGLDHGLAALGLIGSPGQLMHTPFSLVLGMTYTYLPFMVLPLYASLARLDLRLLEAAADLGATPFVAFWHITVPLSRTGIVAGSMLVFIPCVGEFVIPELLGGPETLMIGRVIWDEFFANNDWPMAAAVTVVMVALIIVPLALFSRTHAPQAAP